MAVIEPNYKITYNSKDITRAIDPYLKSITYTDRAGGDSDELDVTVDDSTGKWSNEWYPDQGAMLELFIGYEGNMLPAGKFEIDKIKLNWSTAGRSVSMKALSVITSKALRTKRDQAYENIKLRVLAETVASRAKLTVEGKIANILIERETQFGETDLGFLYRVASEHGYTFNVRPGKLVFTQTNDLHVRKSIYTIKPTMVKSLDLDDETGRTFRVASHRHFDPYKGRSIRYKTDSQKGVVGEDEDVAEGYVENKQQAELRAQARRLQITDSQIKAALTLHTGVPTCVAGNNVQLEGFGFRDGKFAIETSTHTITPDGGYITDLAIYSIDL